MRRPAQIVLASAARLYLPVLALFALSLFVTRAPGSGVGFIAGLGFVMVLVLHVLVFGVDAARVAAPPLLSRLLLSLGLILALVGAAAPQWRWAGQAAELGVFAATIGAGAIALIAIVGRAPSLRDEDW